jgi:protein-S-isoprenylcysteine O-methyltransferase Ste14
MIAWTNFGVLVISAVLFTYFYIRSVGPAALEKKVGEVAYARCRRYRIIASVFEVVVVATYIVYAFYPLPVPLPDTFPWNWWISFAIAVVILVPSAYLMARGLKDAGEESLSPRKEHRLCGGIYTKMRHPQATGEVALWWVIAFILDSPFLAVFSVIWVPIFYMMCRAEEKDLVIRYGKPYLEYRKNTPFLILKRKS